MLEREREKDGEEYSGVVSLMVMTEVADGNDDDVVMLSDSEWWRGRGDGDEWCGDTRGVNINENGDDDDEGVNSGVVVVVGGE